MYIFNQRRISLDTNIIFSKLKPYLIHGALILVSKFSHYNTFISPTPVKHCGFCYIENNEYFVYEMNETGLKKQPILEFLKHRSTFFIFYYYDLDIMKQAVENVFYYKDVSYSVVDPKKQYCYKLIFDIYNIALNYKYKKMKGFFPVFQIFGQEFANSNSVFLSKKFIPQCAIINNFFIQF